MRDVDVLAGLEALTIMDRDASGWVESVSRKAIYLKTVSDDILILSPEPLTPYTLVVGREWPKVQEVAEKGMEVWKDGGAIILGGRTALRIRGYTDDSPIPTGCLPGRENLLIARKVVQVLASISHDEVIPEGVKILRERGPDMEMLKTLIGRGIGATPSGDDFIAGTLLGLHIIGGRESTEPLKRGLQTGTGWLSRCIVEHSSHGCTYTPLARLCRTMASDGDVVEWVSRTVRIGSTTGLSTMVGLLETFGYYYKSLSRTSSRSFSSSGGGLQLTSTT